MIGIAAAIMMVTCTYLFREFSLEEGGRGTEKKILLLEFVTLSTAAAAI